MLELQNDALPLEGRRVGLNLNVLIQQTVNCFLCFTELDAQAGIGMQSKLLLNSFREVPAKKKQGLISKAFGVQKPPRILAVSGSR